MKTYEELLSDIEEDMELMGASHIVYSAEENGVITDYDYLPSDLCMTSTTLKDLQEKLHEQMLYDKASAYTAGADKNAPKLAVIFPGIGYTADKPLLYYTKVSNFVTFSPLSITLTCVVLKFTSAASSSCVRFFASLAALIR